MKLAKCQSTSQPYQLDLFKMMFNKRFSNLAGLRYQLQGEVSPEYGVDSYFSPIDVTIRNDQKNPLHSELYITFNRDRSLASAELDYSRSNQELPLT